MVTSSRRNRPYSASKGISRLTPWRLPETGYGAVGREFDPFTGTMAPAGGSSHRQAIQPIHPVGTKVDEMAGFSWAPIIKSMSYERTGKMPAFPGS